MKLSKERIELHIGFEQSGNKKQNKNDRISNN